MNMTSAFMTGSMDLWQQLGQFFLYAVLAAFAQNAIFSRSLGVSRLFALVGEPSLNTVWFCGLLAAVQLLCAPLSWIYAEYLYVYVPAPLLAPLRPAVYLACSFIALLVVELFLSFFPAAHRAELRGLLPLAALNCCVLGTMLITGGQHYTLVQSLAFALGSAVGYTLAVALVSEAQRSLRNSEIPEAFKGLPVTLIYIGILALAIYSATGHMLSV